MCGAVPGSSTSSPNGRTASGSLATTGIGSSMRACSVFHSHTPTLRPRHRMEDSFSSMQSASIDASMFAQEAKRRSEGWSFEPEAELQVSKRSILLTLKACPKLEIREIFKSYQLPYTLLLLSIAVWKRIHREKWSLRSTVSQRSTVYSGPQVLPMASCSIPIVRSPL